MITLMKNAFRRAVARLLEQQVRRLITAHNLKVVAVAGSVGKTSTKMAVAHALGGHWRVMVQEGNYNSEIGLPLMVFGQTVPSSLLNPLQWLARFARAEQLIRGSYPYDVMVLELGTDHPGEIAHFMTYLEPDVGVLTAVAPEHMEYFTGLDAVAAEEMAIAAGSKVIIVNRDDVKAEYRTKYLNNHQRALTYGVGDAADYSVHVKDADLMGGTDCSLLKNGHATVVGLNVGVYGGPAIKTVAAAYAVGDVMGVPLAELEHSLAQIVPVAGRMRVLAGANGSTIIDDTYNSSPEAVAAAIAALMDVTTAGRRIAIMGSMNELGTESPRYHEQAGRACSGVDMLVTIGELANKHLGPAAVKAGLAHEQWHTAASPYAAGELVRGLLQPGDVVLSKGSQNGVFAEEAVKLLLANPDDATVLVRQSPSWLAKKAKQFEV